MSPILCPHKMSLPSSTYDPHLLIQNPLLHKYWGCLQKKISSLSYEMKKLVWFWVQEKKSLNFGRIGLAGRILYTGCSSQCVKSNVPLREPQNTKYVLGHVISFHWDRAIFRFSFEKIHENNSLAAKGELAHRLQCRTAFKTQNGR